MKCGGQARSEIPWLKISERQCSQQLSARRRCSAEGHCNIININILIINIVLLLLLLFYPW